MSSPDSSTGNDDSQQRDSDLGPIVSDSDITPHTPAVIEVRKVPSGVQPQLSSAPKEKIAALVVLLGTALTLAIDDRAAKTPRTPRVVHMSPGNNGGKAGTGSTGGGGSGGNGLGGTEDASAGNGGNTDIPPLCPPDPAGMYPDPIQLYGTSGPYVKEGAPPSDPPCEFDPNGSKEVVVGTEYIDGAVIYHCFFSSVWAKGAAIRLAGKIEADKKFPGQIKLHEGLLDVTIGLDTNDDGTLDASETAEKKVLVEGEAALAITTTGRVSISKIDGTDEVMVVAENGEALVVQDGVDEPIRLKECEMQRFHLNVVSSSCYIADTPGSSGTENNGGKIILAAGAIFLALRKKTGKQSK